MATVFDPLNKKQNQLNTSYKQPQSNHEIDLKVKPPIFTQNIRFKKKLKESTKCCCCINIGLELATRIWFALFGICIIWALIEEFTLMQFISNDDDWYHYFTMSMIFKDVIGCFIIGYSIWAIHYVQFTVFCRSLVYFILALVLSIIHLVILFIMDESIRALIGISVCILCQIGLIDTFRKIVSLSKHFSPNKSVALNINH